MGRLLPPESRRPDRPARTQRILQDDCCRRRTSSCSMSRPTSSTSTGWPGSKTRRKAARLRGRGHPGPPGGGWQPDEGAGAPPGRRSEAADPARGGPHRHRNLSGHPHRRRAFRSRADCPSATATTRRSTGATSPSTAATGSSSWAPTAAGRRRCCGCCPGRSHPPPAACNGSSENTCVDYNAVLDDLDSKATVNPQGQLRGARPPGANYRPCASSQPSWPPRIGQVEEPARLLAHVVVCCIRRFPHAS